MIGDPPFDKGADQVTVAVEAAVRAVMLVGVPGTDIVSATEAEGAEVVPSPVAVSCCTVKV